MSLFLVSQYPFQLISVQWISCLFVVSRFLFPDNICLITCLLISSLPEPFPDNSVLSFVWICLVLIHACPRQRLLPAPPVPPHRDSRFRPTPVHWTPYWITLIITVCQRTILDCCFSLKVHFNKEHHFFAPEFCLAIGSCYRILTERSSQNGSSGPNSGSAPATRSSVGTTSRRNHQPSPGNGGPSAPTCTASWKYLPRRGLLLRPALLPQQLPQ